MVIRISIVIPIVSYFDTIVVQQSTDNGGFDREWSVAIKSLLLNSPPRFQEAKCALYFDPSTHSSQLN